MSMSTYVIGFKPPDEKWKAMKKVWDACQAADIDTPKDVEEYFDGDEPDDAGVVVELRKHACCKEYGAEMQSGYEIDVTKLPKDVTIIRFVNSY